MVTSNFKNVYFQRSNGDFVLLWEDCPLEDVLEVIQEFLTRHNYKSYYTRSWSKDGVMWYDVGSHTEFFAWAKEVDVLCLGKIVNNL